MTRFFKSALFPLVVIVGVVFLISLWVGDNAGGAGKIDQYRKEKLARLDPLYEIVNDKGDHGNYIELYRVPIGDGKTVFCVVYSDQMEGGGGAGISCNWQTLAVR